MRGWNCITAIYSWYENGNQPPRRGGARRVRRQTSRQSRVTGSAMSWRRADESVRFVSWLRALTSRAQCADETHDAADTPAHDGAKPHGRESAHAPVVWVVLAAEEVCTLEGD